LITTLQAGEDISGDISADTVDSSTAGQNLSGDVDATTHIGTVSVGSTLLGDLTAETGSIGDITAGSDAWGDDDTVSGSIDGSSISAGTSVGSITVNAAPGYDGSISDASVDANNGSIGAITAATGIDGAFTASDSIGAIKTTSGDISGSLMATSGNLGKITASNGAISASLTAGGNIGDLIAANNISGTVSAGGNIGQIVTLGSISGSITAGTACGTIGNIFAGDNLSGAVKAGNSIGTVTAGPFGGTISGALTATHGSIGLILSFGNISSAISSGSGDLSIVATGGIAGAVTGHGTITAFANGAISGAMTTTTGEIYSYSTGDTTGAISALGAILSWAGGSLSSSETSTNAGIVDKAGSSITSTDKANGEIDVMSMGGSITGATFTSGSGAEGFGNGIQNVKVDFSSPSSGSSDSPSEQLTGDSDGRIDFQALGATGGVGTFSGEIDQTINPSFAALDDGKALDHLYGTMDAERGVFESWAVSLHDDFSAYLGEASAGVKAIPSGAAWSNLYTMQVDATSNRLAKVMIQNPDDSTIGSYVRGSIVFANDQTGGTSLGEWALNINLEDARDLTTMESYQRAFQGGGQFILTAVGASETLDLGKQIVSGPITNYSGSGVSQLKTWFTTYNGSGLEYSGTGILTRAQSIAAKQEATAWKFYGSTTDFSESQIASHLQGIDFNNPIAVETLPAGTKVVQYQYPGQPTGNYFAPVGTPPESLGINPTGRIARIYTTKENVTVFRSIARNTTDSNLPTSFLGGGGGTQYFAPDISGFGE
jgi:hypothetical protein